MDTFGLPDRFWRRVDKSAGGCWLWTGGAHEFGHGRYWLNGANRPAHRVIWEARNGHVPDGLFVLHKCDVPSCVNPDHLFVGTQDDNMRDKTEKGRQYRPAGDKHHRRRLSSIQVVEIRRRLSLGESGASLARSFGVNPNTIYNIAANRTWTNASV